MALEERTRIREVLFVQDDKTLVWHAHQVPITEILSNGSVIAARYGVPETLDVEGSGEVLGPAMIEITAERDQLRRRIAELEQQLEDLQAGPAG